MSYIEIEQTELSDKERAVIKAGGERWASLARGRHLDDWLALIEPLMIGRRLALHIAKRNTPTGRLYSEAFGNFTFRHFHGLNNVSISCLLWLADDPERLAKLAELRAAMSEAERARLNSPITARQKVEKALKPPAPKPEPKPAPKPAAPPQVAPADAQIATAIFEERVMHEVKQRLRIKVDLDPAVRQRVRELEAEVEARVQRGIQARIEQAEHGLREINDRLKKENEALRDAQRGFMTNAQFAKLQMALHPDNTVSEPDRRDLLMIFREHKSALIRKPYDPNRRNLDPTPKDQAEAEAWGRELRAARAASAAKAAATRAAKQAAKEAPP